MKTGITIIVDEFFFTDGTSQKDATVTLMDFKRPNVNLSNPAEVLAEKLENEDWLRSLTQEEINQLAKVEANKMMQHIADHCGKTVDVTRQIHIRVQRVHPNLN